MDDLLTTRQLQDLLQVDRITIYRMLSDGRLHGFKVGGQWRFSRQSIQRWLQEQQGAPHSAPYDQNAEGPPPSPDMLPLSCVQAIQSIFAEALGLGAVTTALDGVPLTPISNSCAFCDLILGSEVGRQGCLTSWQAAVLDPGATPLPATCHAGLRHVRGRIQVQGRCVATIHAGQFLDGPPTGDDWSRRITELSAMTGIPAPELVQALYQVPILDQDRQQRLPHLVQRLASTLSEMGDERFGLLGRLRRIAEITEL